MLRRLVYFTGRGHSDGVTCVCAGSSLTADRNGGQLNATVNQVVVTGSKDGNAALWEIDKVSNAFRLKVLLVPSDHIKSRKKGRVNAVACFLVEPQLSTDARSGLYRDAFVLTAQSVAGVQVWHFRASPDASLGIRAARPIRFVDGLSSFGLPERHKADGSCSHVCGECGHDAEVLCLALAPPRSPELAATRGFCFSFFTGTTEGRARLWDVFKLEYEAGKEELKGGHLRLVEAEVPRAATFESQDDPFMVMENAKSAHGCSVFYPFKYRLRHARASEVLCIVVSPLLDKTVVITGDSLGMAKLWLYGVEPQLLQTFAHEARPSTSCFVQSVIITPRVQWNDEQYLVSSSGDATCFVWTLVNVQGHEPPQHTDVSHVLEKYYFRAAAIGMYLAEGPTKRRTYENHDSRYPVSSASYAGSTVPSKLSSSSVQRVSEGFADSRPTSADGTPAVGIPEDLPEDGNPLGRPRRDLSELNARSSGDSNIPVGDAVGRQSLDRGTSSAHTENSSATIDTWDDEDRRISAMGHQKSSQSILSKIASKLKFKGQRESDAALGPTGLFAVTGSSDGTAKMWHLMTLEGIFTVPIWRADDYTKKKKRRGVLPKGPSLGGCESEKLRDSAKVAAFPLARRTLGENCGEVSQEGFKEGEDTETELDLFASECEEGEEATGRASTFSEVVNRANRRTTASSGSCVDPTASSDSCAYRESDDIPNAHRKVSGSDTFSSVSDRPICSILKQFRHKSTVNAVVTCAQQRLKTGSSIGLPSLPRSSEYMDSSAITGVHSVTARPVLLTASDDRCCMLWSLKKGEPLRAFRPASLFEMFVPLGVMVLNFLQIVHFAFAADLRMGLSPGRNPSSSASHAAALDPSLLLAWLSLDHLKTTFTLVCISCATLVAVFFSACALFDVLQAIGRRMTNIETTPAFRLEVREGLNGDGLNVMGPLHRAFRRLWVLQILAALMLRLGSTVLLMPVSKVILSSYHCERTGGDLYLVWNPSMQCYQGRHLVLCVLVTIPFMTFLAVLMPYSVVRGNSWVVARSDLFRVSRWLKNCEQESGLLFLGPMHTHARHAFVTTIVENLTKVVCPALHMGLYAHKTTRLVGMLTVNVLSLIIFVTWRPYQCFSMNTLVIAFKVAVVYAYSIALSAQIIPAEEFPYPGATWHGGAIGLAIVATFIFRFFSLREEKQEEQRILDMCSDPHKFSRRVKPLKKARVD